MDDDTIDELWQILNSDEPIINRLELAKELVKDWADDNQHDLPEILEFTMDDEEEEDDNQ